MVWFRKKENEQTGESRGPLPGGSGFILVLVILFLFFLTSVYLKSLFFGLIVAYLFLPLEQTFEKYFFSNRVMRSFSHCVEMLISPIRKFKNRFIKAYPKTEEILATERRERLAFQGTVMTLFSLVIAFLVVLGIISSVGGPVLNDARKALHRICVNQTASSNFEERSIDFLYRIFPSEQIEQKQKLTVTEKKEKIQNLVRNDLQGILKKYGGNMTKFLLSKTTDFISHVISFAASIGSFLFELVMFCVFFFFFLQKMAVFSGAADSEKESGSSGSWLTKTIQDSPWFPSFSPETQKSAAKIIDRIGEMFNAWIRGYFCIILIEVCLYFFIFEMFSIPFAPVLALISGCTVLLPFLGLTICVTLTVVVTLIFAEVPLAFALTGVAVAYVCVNLILEQFFLYPRLVGGAIGLTTIETIIVVLLGASLGGVVGMILAVPAAALIKLLVPMIYTATQRGRSGENNQEKKS